jgi:hypothetical protein
MEQAETSYAYGRLNPVICWLSPLSIELNEIRISDGLDNKVQLIPSQTV